MIILKNLIGMKENIKLAKLYYPSWEIRIYHNSTVPNKYIEEYKRNGAICILCENRGENQFNWEGMFWRWFPLDDREVEIWLSRDADSRLSAREAKTVEEWINSGKTLHSIRDHRCHYGYIMGGLFGVKSEGNDLKLDSGVEYTKLLLETCFSSPSLSDILSIIFPFCAC